METECTRCGSGCGDTIRYAQMVDENRNWGVRTEDMKAICQLCAGEVMAFVNTPISRSIPRTGRIKRVPGAIIEPASKEQGEE